MQIGVGGLSICEMTDGILFSPFLPGHLPNEEDKATLLERTLFRKVGSV
jgi:hypothetical protein